MTRCGLYEMCDCTHDATRRVVWDMVTDDPQIIHLCDDCTREYDAAIINDLGPIDPREIPAEQRSRTLNRFLPKIKWGEVDDVVEDCWLWNASTLSGYGQFRYWDVSKLAHRYSYERCYGIEPPAKEDDTEIMHGCGVKKCANPAHLWEGTSKQNTDHAVECGRIDRLPPEQAGEIRERYDEEDVTQRELAEDYDCSHMTISRVVNHVSYSDDDVDATA